MPVSHGFTLHELGTLSLPIKTMMHLTATEVLDEGKHADDLLDIVNPENAI